MDIETTWGTIGVELLEGKVVGCTLPHLDREPKLPFSIKSQIGDEASRFIASVFQGLETTVPDLGKLKGTDFHSLPSRGFRQRQTRWIFCRITLEKPSSVPRTRFLKAATGLASPEALGLSMAH